MNIGIFYCCGDRPFMSHDYVYGGGGGTETCIVQLAEKMAENHSVKVLWQFDFILFEYYYKGIVNLTRLVV